MSDIFVSTLQLSKNVFKLIMFLLTDRNNSHATSRAAEGGGGGRASAAAQRCAEARDVAQLQQTIH